MSFTLKHRRPNGVLQWIKVCSLKLSSKGKTFHLTTFWTFLMTLQFCSTFITMQKRRTHGYLHCRVDRIIWHTEHSISRMFALYLQFFLYLWTFSSWSPPTTRTPGWHQGTPEFQSHSVQQISKLRVIEDILKTWIPSNVLRKLADNRKKQVCEGVQWLDLGEFVPDLRWHLAIEPLGGQPASQGEWQRAELESVLQPGDRQTSWTVDWSFRESHSNFLD